MHWRTERGSENWQCNSAAEGRDVEFRGRVGVCKLWFKSPPPKKNSIKFPKTFFTDSDCLPHPSRTGQTEEVSSLSFSYCFVVFNSELGRVVKMLREVIFLKKKTGGNIQCCILTNVSGEKCCLKKARWQYGDMLQATLTVCVCVIA